MDRSKGKNDLAGGSLLIGLGADKGLSCVDASSIWIHGSKLTFYLPVQETSPIRIEIRAD